MRRSNKKSTVGKILMRSIVMQNIEYLLNGSRYIAQMSRGERGNRLPLPVGATSNEALTL